jgi:hypothetical protein
MIAVRAHVFSALVAAAASTAALSVATAQCALSWQSGSSPGPGSYANCAATWDPDGAGPAGPVFAVGGSLTVGTTSTGLAIHDPVAGSWGAMAGWIWGPVAAIAVAPNGDLVAADQVQGPQGITSTIVRLTGNQWTVIGTTSTPVAALAFAANGDVFAGGNFASISGVPAANIARWNGSTWSALGAGTDGVVLALLVRANGDLVAGGWFTNAGGVLAIGIAAWNGGAWSPVGPGFFTGAMHTIAELANGDLVAGGQGTQGLRRWNGVSWTNVQHPAGLLPVNMRPEAVLQLPNGDLLTAGEDGSPVPTDSVYRWTLGWALAAQGGADGTIHALAWHPAGYVGVGGQFSTLGGAPAPGFAVLATSCPASVVATGAGCASSGGGNVMRAPPAWTGTTWTATASGLPAQAFVLGVSGLTPASLPLANVFPQAGPGCTLHVTPDLLALSFASAGTASSSLQIPASPALVGQSFDHQLVAIEFTAGLAFVAVTATNAARMTIGTY